MIQVSSVVHQDNPEVLRAWLWGLAGLDTSGLKVCHSFILHNPVGYEREMIAKYLPGAEIEEMVTEHKPILRGQYSHQWGTPHVDTVLGAKNRLIDKALHAKNDIFFCDSDQVLQPETLKQLDSLQQHVCGEVLWTKWKPNEPERPNAWDFGDYIFKADTEKKLREPGVYKVGFIGGLLLIRIAALWRGLNYERIPNLTFWGEDRHFGVRAAVLGFDMVVDTHYPAFHIYRDSDLDRLPEWVTLRGEVAAAISGGVQ
ncbi:MAG: hypothetical protein WC565_08395 [Parcubacteria group bacterium]